MQMTSTLVYLHVLLMVFWLGTDIGVFIAGLRFMDPKRSLEERAAVINLGMVIDRYPRICFVAILPVGLQIAYLRGIVPALSAQVLILAWALAVVWMTAVIVTMRLHGKAAARPWQALERWFRIVGFLGFTGLGIAGWTQNLILPGWLAGKLVGYRGDLSLCVVARARVCARGRDLRIPPERRLDAGAGIGAAHPHALDVCLGARHLRSGSGLRLPRHGQAMSPTRQPPS